MPGVALESLEYHEEVEENEENKDLASSLRIPMKVATDSGQSCHFRSDQTCHPVLSLNRV
jgi:hypothetical protein